MMSYLSQEKVIIKFGALLIRSAAATPARARDAGALFNMAEGRQRKSKKRSRKNQRKE